MLATILFKTVFFVGIVRILLELTSLYTINWVSMGDRFTILILSGCLVWGIPG